MKIIFYSLTILQLLLAFCGIEKVYSQPLVTQQWVARYPGPSNDYIGPFLQVDKSGNSYLAGTHVVNDSINILCAKYNTYGVQQWAVFYKYSGYGYYAPTDLALDSSGNAYVISGCGLNTLTPRNMIIIKFNSLNGSVTWVKKYMGDYYESSFFDIKIDNQNNIYVVGGSDTSHLVIRYNSNGDSVWVRKYHPPPYPPFSYVREVARACTIDDSLNIIFTGQRMDHYAPGNYDYDSLLVAKYSPTGVLRWERVYAYNLIANNVGTKITSDQNGSVYIGGSTSISGNGVFLALNYDRNGAQQWAKIYQGNGGGISNLSSVALDRNNSAFFVTGIAQINGVPMATTIKYNAVTGDSIWVRKDTGTFSNGDSRDIKIDNSGNCYITGATSKTGSYAPIDIMSIKYNTLGTKQWLITYNGTFNGVDLGRYLSLDSLNNVYVLGTSQSSSQLSDYVVIKYSQLSGINPINGKIPHKFSLGQNYPNPFNPVTKIRFSVPKKSFITLRVFDILGRIKKELIKKELSSAEYEISFDGSNYSSGVYLYQLMEDGNIVDTKKMVIIK